MIKAVFFDIDGTLIDFGQSGISNATRSSLEKLQSNGIKVFIATGRSANAVKNIYPFDGYVVMNGQMVIYNEKVIYEAVIPSRDVLVIYDELEKRDYTGIFMCEKQYMNRYSESLYSLKHLGFREFPLITREELRNHKVYQMTVLYPYSRIGDIIGGAVNVIASSWHEALADVMSPGNDKAAGIERLINFLNIKKEETMSFGDGGNDIQMLEYTQVGVAMGNSNDEVKSHADFVTLNCNAEGVEYALKHFKLID